MSLPMLPSAERRAEPVERLEVAQVELVVRHEQLGARARNVGAGPPHLAPAVVVLGPAALEQHIEAFARRARLVGRDERSVPDCVVGVDEVLPAITADTRSACGLDRARVYRRQ